MGWFDDNISHPIGNAISGGASSIGNAVNTGWKNAGRGEIGKWVGGIGQSGYNLALAAPRAITTGQYGRQIGAAAGSALNLYTYGATNYLGQSSGVNRMLNSDPVIGKNIAAGLRVSSNLANVNAVSNADRNLTFQGGAKVGAAVAAAYGGYAAYGALSAAAPTAAAEGGGAVLVESGTPLASAGAVTSTDIAAGSAGPLAASGGSSWGLGALGSKTLEVGTTAAILKAVTGGSAPGGQAGSSGPISIGGTDPTSGGFWGGVNDLVGQLTGQSHRNAAVYQPGMNGLSADPTGQTSGIPVAAAGMPIGLMAVAAIGLWYAHKKRFI